MTAWIDFLRARGASFDGATVATFGNPAGELAAARDAAIVCDLGALAALRVAGADAESFLQGQKRVKGKRRTAIKNIGGRGRE